MRVGWWFVGGLWAFGLASAFAVAGSPGLRDGVFPSFAWPLLVSLAADLALMPLARRGAVEPLTVNERALGVIGAGLVHTLALMALPA